jgi:hypothetical protein
MKKLILLLGFIFLFIRCKNEVIEHTFCWECISYVTSIDTLHKTLYQNHFELDTLCDKNDASILIITKDKSYIDTFLLSSGHYYTCVRTYTTVCKKLNDNNH